MYFDKPHHCHKVDLQLFSFSPTQLRVRTSGLIEFLTPTTLIHPRTDSQAPHRFTSANKDVPHLIGFVAKRDAAHILSEDLLWESLESSWID